jgi:hypothetical protein
MGLKVGFERNQKHGVDASSLFQASSRRSLSTLPTCIQQVNNIMAIQQDSFAIRIRSLAPDRDPRHDIRIILSKANYAHCLTCCIPN